jgi:hypothetical protein
VGDVKYTVAVVCAKIYAMLTPQCLRTLTVDPALHPRGQAHLSAASGLVCLNGRFYVVADDEHHLGVFNTTGNAHVDLVRLFAGDLPERTKKRKAVKPDIESLASLPAMPGYPFGALLALGSGSKPTRERGLLLALDAHQRLVMQTDLAEGQQAMSLEALYAPLRDTFADLNLEGCFVANGMLHLLQRGNQCDARSACIQFDWAATQKWLLSSQDTQPPRAVCITPIHLGLIDGVPLTPTDGAALPDGGWLLSAAAENTSNSYADGPCAGSALAVLGADGQLKVLHRLRGAPKVEGITATVDANQVVVSMVTDADDPDAASQLLSVSFHL